jgi:hypothetical protein
MFLTNAMKGTLTQYNRGVSGVYDDEDQKTVTVQLCPYNQDVRVAFGTYTVPEAEGYYIVKSSVDVKEGDQITFMDKTYTVIKVKDNWIWNKIVNYTVAVK